MWMQDGCKVYMDSYMASNGSCFMDTIQKPPLKDRSNTKPGDHDTLNVHNRWFILFYHVWRPLHGWKFIKIAFDWGPSHIWLHTTLKDPWPHYKILGRPLETFFWAPTKDITWARVCTGPQPILCDVLGGIQGLCMRICLYSARYKPSKPGLEERSFQLRSHSQHLLYPSLPIPLSLSPPISKPSYTSNCDRLWGRESIAAAIFHRCAHHHHHQRMLGSWFDSTELRFVLVRCARDESSVWGSWGSPPPRVWAAQSVWGLRWW
jgi:hypothetical protein